jgi:hypothetical protein
MICLDQVPHITLTTKADHFGQPLLLIGAGIISG